jgi:TetR/AcrR family transcriptional repressor of mexJK operon
MTLLLKTASFQTLQIEPTSSTSIERTANTVFHCNLRNGTLPYRSSVKPREPVPGSASGKSPRIDLRDRMVPMKTASKRRPIDPSSAASHGKSRAQVKRRHPIKSHRARILEAGSALFFKLGYQNTTTEKIARQAKVSKREVYLHFKDKRQILASVISEVQAQMQSRMLAEWSSPGDIRIVLTRAAKAIHEFVLSERVGNLVGMLAAVSYHDPELAAQFFEMGPLRGRRETARYFKQQMKLGNLRQDDHLKAADDFLDLVVGGQLITAVALGCSDAAHHKYSTPGRAVHLFLAIYAPNTKAKSSKPWSKRSAGDTKTEAIHKPVPLHVSVCEVFAE